MKFETTKLKKTSIWGGVGSAVFLVLLMALMPMGGMVAPMDESGSIMESEEAEAKADPFALPTESIGTIELEDRDPAKELLGMRGLTQKAYVEDNGEITIMTFNDPAHYVSDNGAWEEIDTNVVPTPYGWEVAKNLFTTEFASDVGSGIAVQANPNVDPVIVGIQPMLVTLDITGTAPEPVHVGYTDAPITIGGNTIRYPLAEGYDLDYQVESLQVKQNLIIRNQPVLEENHEWFGLSEMVRLPVDYALFLGDIQVTEEIVMTQEPLQVRHIETGELLVEFPSPMVIEPSNPEMHMGTYFVSSAAGIVFLTTAVESGWLMDMNRTYPINLDPTIKVTQNKGSYGGGYCYVYYGYCYDGYYSYLYRYYGSFYYLPWHGYTFSAQNLGTAAYATKVTWNMYRSYYYSYSTNLATATYLQNCGADVRYNYGITSSSCSGDISSNLLSGSGSLLNERKLISSIWNSGSLTGSTGNVATGTGWKQVTVCNSQTACASGNGNKIFNAMNSGGTKGVGMKYTTSTYHYTYSYNSGSTKSYYAVTYGGASDTAAPAAQNYAAYDGITSYKEGARTFFIDLKDNSGIDTTSTNGPKMYYSVDNGSYTSVSATTIGTCNSAASQCQFRATTGDISAGDYIKYYWEYQDLASTPNSGTTPSSGQHWFFVDDVANAGTAKKFQVQMTQRSAYSAYQPVKYFDQLMTYYDSSDEFVFEFDTSDCGTGSSSCFYTSNYYFYQMWKMKWTTAPSSGYNGFGGTQSGEWNMMADVDAGFITLTANNGPGMNLIYLYDSSANKWSVTGLDTSTGIDETLSGGDTKTHRGTYGYTKHWNIKLDDISGTVGKFDFNGTYSSSKANWLCQSTNGFVYFFRSTSSNPICNGGYYYAYAASYRWTGFAIGTGYYGSMASGGATTWKVSKVAPEPDRTAPEFDHSGLADSHSKKRTITVGIADGGEPPSGLDTSNSIGVGPTLYYKLSTESTWRTTLLTPDDTRANCKLKTCEWTATLDADSGDSGEDFTARGNTIEYKLFAKDVNSDSAGPNDVTSSVMSFEVGDPNKVFVVEWHDIGYNNNQYSCNMQAMLYDTTNEIEFKYDTGCSAYYDYSTIGYQNSARNTGATIRAGGAGYLAGSNPFTSNYRIYTDGSTDHGWEKFDMGLSEITNYKVAIQGSSNGYPYLYYCSSTYWWNTYKAGCDANIDLPDGFEFEYFGNTFDGDDSDSRVMISRFGAMYLKDTTSTAPERAMTTWYSNQPDLPYSSNVASRGNLMAVWWGGYTSYYCYSSTSSDCSVRYRVMPFEGKGTDVDASTLTDVQWDMIDSPIRINPPGDYLSITGDVSIAPGVVVQVAAGKGISIDGSCSNAAIAGNATDHVLFEGQQGQKWTGLAFTAGCSSGTDDRHEFTYVDFANTTDAAISAGSRHGSAPSTNSNVGNFSMSDVTFSNVGSAISHGSGDGTSFDMTNVEVDDSSGSCFDFPTDAVVTMTNVDLDVCNSDGSSTGGAIVNDGGSTGGSLTIESLTVANSYVNLIVTDLGEVDIANVSASHSATQSGSALSVDSPNSRMSVTNMDADDYSSVGINSLNTYIVNAMDVGSANIGISPGGTMSTATGPSNDDAKLVDVTGGALSMARTAPYMENVDLSGAWTVSGNSPTTDAMDGKNVDAAGVSFQGCGYAYNFYGMDVGDGTADAYISSSCSSSNAPNRLVIDGGTIATDSTSNNVVYARNSKIVLGGIAITGMTSMGNNVAKASSNGEISMIGVTWNGDDCADTSGWTGATECWVQISSSSGKMYFGGYATASVFKMQNVSGVLTKVWKPDHTVTAELVDSAGASVTAIGRHLTNGTGVANVWVLNTVLVGSSLTSTSFTNHNLVAFGAAGMNESMDVTYGIGDSIELRLFPAPIDFDQPNMDCSWLNTNSTTNAVQTDTDGDGNWDVYMFDETPMTLSADLNIDGCTIVLMGAAMRIKSDATISPTLTISNGGTVIVNVSTSNSVGAIKASSSSYPMHIDIQDGTLWSDGGIIKDHAQSSSTGSALYVGTGATLKLTNQATIWGLSANSDDMATLEVNGGTLTGDGGVIKNSGGTGTGVWFENTQSSMANLAVSGAAVGIKSHNAAPQLDGFTVTDSDVGVDVYGGMSLPMIYRSTSLSGMNAGWNTYSFDISQFMSKDYVQLGYNSIWDGGNAHPTYNYATSKYYMMTDRMWVEFDIDTNGDGVGDTSYNHSARTADTRTSPGYYNGHAQGSSTAVTNGQGTDTSSEYAGYNYYDCNLYAYNQNPAYQDYGYWYYFQVASYLNNLGISGAYSSSGSYYGAASEPVNFGYRVEAADGLSSANSLYYPYHYWGYYYTNYHTGGNSNNVPPEGLNGLFGNYNICMDYAYTYYTSPGAGHRIAMPIIDMDNQGDGAGGLPTGAITGGTLNIDFFHNRADNYQDRIEILARTSNDLGDFNNGDGWVREMGTPSFTDGSISNADVGIEIGGSYAAADFTNIDVTSTTSAGLVMDGSAMFNVDGLDVTGANYCVSAGLTAAGRMGLSNLNCQSQLVAGVSYARDVSGDFSGTITGSLGPAVEYGSATKDDHSFSSLNLATNAVGMQFDGGGTFDLVDCNFANTVDIAVGGSSEVNFVDGDIDDNATEVSGTGVIKRSRSLTMTVDADGSTVDGAKVLLMAGDSSITGSATTANGGVASGIRYNTMIRNSAGADWPALSGYTVATTAKVAYTSTKMDFRYKAQAVNLDPSAPSSDTLSLGTSDIMNHRVCYTFASASYVMMATCSIGTGAKKGYDNDGDGTNDAWEYGYFGAADTDMSGKTIMMDTPFFYVDSDSGSSTKNNWNNTEIVATGSYSFYGYQRWTATYPYNSHMYINNSNMISLAESDGVQSGIMIGYYAWSDINAWVTNTTIVGMSGIATGRESTSWDPDHFNVADNVLIRAGGPGSPKNSFGYQEMCIVNSGIHDAIVTNNVISGCPVGVMVRNTLYTYYFTQSVWGSDDMTISGNTFTDTGSLSIWFYFSYADGVEVSGNTFNGNTQPNYQVYAQSQYTTDVTIADNTFTSGANPIYLRGALDYDVKNNDITGNQNSANAGIYTLNGYGSISGNTLTDSDGGIFIDGIRSGQALSVTDNTVASSSGRVAPAAVGIWAEDCGASTLETSGNDVTSVMNGLVIDGCSVEDTGSIFRGTGGAGSTTWSVDIMASYYAPQNLTVNEGDTVRWRAKEYYQGATHTVTSNDTDSGGTWLFDSGSLNLGSSFTHTFSTAGTYDYHCANHQFMSGTITVSTGSGASFSATGVNVISSGNKALTFNGTQVGGYSTGVAMTGGQIYMTGDAKIGGVDYGLDLDGVNVYSSGAQISANDTTGIGLYLTNGGSLDLGDLSTNAAYGVWTDGVDFNWNGGDLEGGTGLYAENRAVGDFQNMTFDSGLTQQIYAGSNTEVTSVGNTLDSAKLGLHATAVIHEANLLSVDTDRDDDYTALTPPVDSEDIGLMITSTDGTKAAYVSSTFRDTSPSIDGDISEWEANPLNPSDDMMPGVMSEDGDDAMSVTWDAQNLYLAVANSDMDSGDLQIYIGHGAAGSDSSMLWDGTQHGLPFLANYAFWAEDGSNPPKDGDSTYTWGLKSWSTGTNSWSDISEGCSWNQDSAYIGWSGNDMTEVAIPWSCIGSPDGTVRLLGVVLGDSDGTVSAVHPTQALAGGNESFDGLLEISTGQLNLGDGDLTDYRLIYRSFIGSNTAGPAKDYDVMVIGDAPCEEDWGTIEDVSMATNVQESVTIERACPFIAAPSFVTVTTTGNNLTGTGYMVGFEDMPAQLIPLTPYGVDMQDLAPFLNWNIEDHPNPQFAPTTLLEYNQWGSLGMTIPIDHDDNASTPDYDMPIGNNHLVNLSVHANQFGNYNVKLTVTDSHGLTDTGYLTVVILPVNDAPVIWNVAHPCYDITDLECHFGDMNQDGQIMGVSGMTPNVPVFVTDSDGNYNVADEGHGTRAYKLGNAIYGLSMDTTYIIDQLNEQPQSYTWQVDVPSSCDAFSVNVENGSEILISENTANEAGGECAITMNLADDGTDAFPVSFYHPILQMDLLGFTFNDAQPKSVMFRINPVNDVPVIHSSFDAANGIGISDGNGNAIALDWAITVLEDTTDANALTFNLSTMKTDIDHEDADLSWSFERHYVEATDGSQQLQCEYSNYFSSVGISGDLMSFTLIPDATTNAPPEEVDKMDDDGVHQERPNSPEGYCYLEMYLEDSALAPAYYPNYGFSTANYSQEKTQVAQILKIKVDNTPEPVPDYFFDASVGFDFHGVSHVISGTEVPMSVEIVGGGDAPPNTDGTYKYDHILAVTFLSDGHAAGDKTAGQTIYVDPPAHGERITIDHPGVEILDETGKVSVIVDIKTCTATTCPAPSNLSADAFVGDDPAAHVCRNEAADAIWTCPGLFQDLADRRTQLEDGNWSNNIMTQMTVPDSLPSGAQCSKNHPYLCLSTGQDLPEIVATKGLASVPSFAPSIMMVSLIGMFVGALIGMNRRDEEEGDYEEEIEDDDAAVSPVIATILMVAITVVLSGVIYVWASSLANTDAKTVPRLGMKLVDVDPETPTGYWRLDVTTAKTELSSQGVIVQMEWAGGVYQTTLTNTTNYGFVPSNVPDKLMDNAPVVVTFADKVECDDQNTNCYTTFGVGDSILIGSHDTNGNKLTDVKVTLRYDPGVGTATLLQTFTNLN